jgi:hypothetical protein
LSRMQMGFLSKSEAGTEEITKNIEFLILKEI